MKIIDNRREIKLLAYEDLKTGNVFTMSKEADTIYMKTDLVGTHPVVRVGGFAPGVTCHIGDKEEVILIENPELHINKSVS